jgi:hypothetical protein
MLITDWHIGLLTTDTEKTSTVFKTFLGPDAVPRLPGMKDCAPALRHLAGQAVQGEVAFRQRSLV